MVTTVLSITLLNQIGGKHFLVETQDKPADEEEFDDTANYDNNVVGNEVDAGTVEIKGLIH